MTQEQKPKDKKEEKVIPENHIEFSKDKITIYLTVAIYNAIEKIARTKYKDHRSIYGVIQTYAIIKLYSRLSFTNTFVPIHRDIFQFISKRNYIDYRNLLRQHNIIEYNRSELTQYKSITNKNCISSKPTEYKMAGIIGGIWDFNKTMPVHIQLPADYVLALKIKHQHILEAYKFSLEKSKEIMSINPMEIVVVVLTARLIKDVLANKVKTKRTLDKRIKVIEQYNKLITTSSDIEPLIKKIIKVVYSNKHIVGNKLLYLINNQHLAQNEIDNVIFKYYKELKVEVSALDECLTKRDLTHLSRINTVPDYGNADKIYSALANIRKPIRKHITYRGANLVEVSDVSCAHFTMLPVILKRYNIAIPSDELQRWLDLTQKADLYSAVVVGSDIKRDDIKQTFQPFLSIKNKAQFLFGQESFELRKRELVCEYFEQNFPAIFNALLSWHTVTEVSIKSVANQVESDIINPICDRLIEDGLHPFRIHDAIYLPENELQYLNFNIKEEVMRRINSEIG